MSFLPVCYHGPKLIPTPFPPSPPHPISPSSTSIPPCLCRCAVCLGVRQKQQSEHQQNICGHRSLRLKALQLDQSVGTRRRQHSLCESAVGSRNSSSVKRRTRDLKVASSSPGRSGGRIFSSADLPFRADSYSVSVPPRVTTVARKRPCSFCQMWQVTPEHAHTLGPNKVGVG